MGQSRFVKKAGTDNEVVPASQRKENSQSGPCPFKQGWSCNKAIPDDVNRQELYMFCIACQLAQVTTELFKLRQIATMDPTKSTVSITKYEAEILRSLAREAYDNQKTSEFVRSILATCIQKLNIRIGTK